VESLEIVAELIQRSRYLQHLDLSHTYLELAGFQKIMAAAKDRNCTSLQALHLSGNPALSELELYKLRKRTALPQTDVYAKEAQAEALYADDHLKGLHSQHLEDHNIPFMASRKEFKLETEAIDEHDPNSFEEKMRRIKQKQIKESATFSKPQDLKADSPTEIFILVRNTHFYGKPDGAQSRDSEWRILKESNQHCWYCRQHAMSVVCFDIDDQSIREVAIRHDTLRHINFEDGCESPQMACDSNNFEAQKLISVEELCELNGISNRRNWQAAFYNNTHFQKVNFINLKESSVYKEGSLFVSWPPLFVEPGKNSFVYKAAGRYFTNHQVCDLRAEVVVPDLVPLLKWKAEYEAYKRKGYERADGEPMTFENLRARSEAVYEECVEADFSHWKGV
jgi:hypothetical protein